MAKPFRKDPFTLLGFHKVLISTAVLACLFFAGWQFVVNSKHDGSSAYLSGAIAVVLAAGLIWYLRGLLKK